MVKEWHRLILKWLNCFGVGSVKNIQDIKDLNFVAALTSHSFQTDEDSFSQLLSYLQSLYPQYDEKLADPTDTCWDMEEELFLLSSLLLLHASIYQPCKTLQQNAAKNLDENDQQLLVSFLEKVMDYGKQLKRNDLLLCTPSGQVRTSFSSNSTPKSPVSNTLKRTSGGLADFLSSPVVKRKSGLFRDRISSLQIDLEQEQAEKIELQQKVEHQDSQIVELVRKLKEKSNELESLQESFKNAEVALSEETGDQRAERRKLQQQLNDSESYVKQLEEEIGILRTSQEDVTHKLSMTEKMYSEMEAILSSTREEICELKEQLQKERDENIELTHQCSKFERDLNQVHLSKMLSPQRPVLDSPVRTPAGSPAPESLGFIVERQMIQKENENEELHSTLKETEKELKRLKEEYQVLEEKASNENECASRAQKKLESKVEMLEKNLNSMSQELSLCKQAKDDINSALLEVTKEKDELSIQLEDLKTAKVNLMSEQKELKDSKYGLEVKVAQMNAKLVIAAERENELADLAKKRASDLDSMTHKFYDMEVNWKKSQKEQKMIEQQLNDAMKKITDAKTLKLEKNDLEDQVTALKQSHENLEKQYEYSCSTKKTLEDKLQTLLDDKKSIELQLKDMSRKRGDLTAALEQVTHEKDSIASEKIALLQEKVRWELEFEETTKRLEETKSLVLKEETEKREIQDKLAEALAANDRLTSHLSISTQQENDLSNHLAEISKQKKAVDIQLAAISKEKMKVEDALQECSSQLVKTQQDHENLIQELNEKSGELEVLKVDFSKLSRSKNDLESVLANEKAENDKLLYNFNEVNRKLELAQEEISKVKDELLSLLKQCEEKSSTISDLQAEKADIEDDLCHYVSSLNSTTQENVCIKSELTSLKTEKDQLLVKYESVSHDKKDLENKFDEAVKALATSNSERESLLVNFTAVSKEKDENSNELINLKNAFALVQSELNDLRNINSRQQNELTEKSSHIEHLLQDMEKLKEDFTVRNKDLQNDCDEKYQQLSLLREDLTELQTCCDILQTEKKKLSEETAILRNKNVALEEEVAKHISEIEALSDKIDKTLEELKKAESDKAEALKHLKETENDHNISLGNIDKLRRENETVLEQLKQAVTEREEAMEQLRSINSAKEEAIMQLGKAEADKETALQQLLSAENAKKEALELVKRVEVDREEALKQLNETEGEKQEALKHCNKAEADKKEALVWVESVETEKKALLSCLEAEKKLKESLLCTLEEKDKLLKELQANGSTKEKLLSDYTEKMLLLEQEKEKLSKELELVLSEKDNLAANINQDVAQQIEALTNEVERAASEKKLLEKEVSDYSNTLRNTEGIVESLKERISVNAQTIQELEAKVVVSTEAERRLQSLCEMKESALQQSKKSEDMIQKLQVTSQQLKDKLEKAGKENEALLGQMYELQGSIDVKEELLSETQACVEKLRVERDYFRDLVTVKEQIINCQKATASSLERQSSDELDVAMKLLEGELHSSQSTSEMMAQELRKVQKTFEDEKIKLKEALAEAQSTAESYQKQAVELKQQLKAPHTGGKIAEAQQEESQWQLDRMKHHLEFQFDTMMNQKLDVEDHLSILQGIIKEASCMCDNVFAVLPPNCDAVHEVTVMRKEVEMKLRTVDKKYAESLCGIISLANEIFKFSKKQTELTLNEDQVNSSLLAERDSIEAKISKSCEGMSSLACDVRSVINSCKFLIERCESYLKAQTRESLKIKTSFGKDTVNDGSTENSSQNDNSGPFKQSSAESIKACRLTAESQVKSNWFGDTSSIEEGYHLLESSHSELEKQIIDLRSQLKELQMTVTQDSNNDELLKLKTEISDLRLRPTHEQLEEKLKELHVQYSNKLENMKLKMKQIVKDEVNKVEEEKQKSEKDIVAKHNKRITEFEEHVQQLSAQLWKLGEKLLQEQQDHKNAKERLEALKERQRQYLMSKQRTQSLDRLDMMLQGSKQISSSTSQLKRRCNSQVTQGGLASAKVHPVSDISPEVDGNTSRRSTMMAPASMGLAFPEEDEDGEVFNNDYLAELKEGKCRVPLDGSRLSELQYRNSLCPPHLKSSYPAETQFQDPQLCKDEDIKGAEGRLRRQGKDKQTRPFLNWPKQTVQEQKRMLLQLRHVLVRPKPARRTIIRQRNCWSEIRELTHPTQLHIRTMLKHHMLVNKPDAEQTSCPPPRLHCSYENKEHCSNALPLVDKTFFPPHNNHQVVQKISLGSSMRSYKLVHQSSTLNCKLKFEAKPSKPLPTCCHRKKLKCNIHKPVKLKTPRRIDVQSKKPNHLKHRVLDEKMRKPVPYGKSQTVTDHMNLKSPKNIYVKSPYSVYSSVSTPKLLTNKPRSLLRLEQTPAYQNPPRIFLRGKYSLPSQRYCQTVRPGRKITTRSAKVLTEKDCNSRGTVKSPRNIVVAKRSPLIPYTKSCRRTPYDKPKSRKVVANPISCRRSEKASKNSEVQTSKGSDSYRIKLIKSPLLKLGNEPTKLQSPGSSQRSRRTSSNCDIHHHALPNSVWEKRNKIPEVQKCLERIAAKLQRLPINGHGPGSVMAERLACDGRLLARQVKWNQSFGSKLLKPPAQETRLTEAQESKMAHGYDLCSSHETGSKLISHNSFHQFNIKSCDNDFDLLQSLNQTALPNNQTQSDSLSPQVGQTLELKGNLVDRVLSRFGKTEGTGKLCELAHTLLPKVEIPIC